jgi:hypothetical protein
MACYGIRKYHEVQTTQHTIVLNWLAPPAGLQHTATNNAQHQPLSVLLIDHAGVADDI